MKVREIMRAPRAILSLRPLDLSGHGQYYEDVAKPLILKEVRVEVPVRRGRARVGQESPVGVKTPGGAFCLSSVPGSDDAWLAERR